VAAGSVSDGTWAAVGCRPFAPRGASRGGRSSGDAATSRRSAGAGNYVVGAAQTAGAFSALRPALARTKRSLFAAPNMRVQTSCAIYDCS
jgi:hypothetical protein